MTDQIDMECSPLPEEDGCGFTIRLSGFLDDKEAAMVASRLAVPMARLIAYCLSSDLDDDELMEMTRGERLQ